MTATRRRAARLARQLDTVIAWTSTDALKKKAEVIERALLIEQAIVYEDEARGLRESCIERQVWQYRADRARELRAQARRRGKRNGEGELRGRAG